MQRIKFSESILIGDSPETVFDFTQDYSKRLQWDTFLIQADLLDGAPHADKGVQAYCVSKNRLGMTTEYITFQRPRGTAIKMTQGPYLFKEFLGSWRFRQVADNSTEVTFLYSFTLRFPFTLATYFIRKNLQQNVRQRLVDLKTCIEYDRAQHTAEPA
jgi:ribosome-associated toxin RatA of RatAB toxin-antitoxin module